MGLFKKVVFADAIAGQTGALFDAAALGLELTFLEAWTAALGFTFQVYFDFSGYSDMALGLSRCFGIVLPLNFHSPYKATNISEFWRRWHITLTRWLRLFLFVPISRRIMRRGGERWDAAAVAVAQMITMGLCGLWHGAGWNFVLWGVLHGGLLVAHDGWVAAKRRLGLTGRLPPAMAAALGRAALLLVLASSFVIFRAENLEVAGRMLETMSGMGSGAGVIFDATAIDRFLATVGGAEALAMTALLIVVWLAPNTQEILADYDPALDLRRFSRRKIHPLLRWRPSARWALFTLASLLVSICAILVRGYEEFIYRFF
jgi:D-alanyl-lipoteichoic acid acyltransferase DltB (MBOAT superfamily)